MRPYPPRRCSKYPCGCTATKRVTVTYGKGFNGPDQDTLVLCDEHARYTKADAERHGYTVKTEEV